MKITLRIDSAAAGTQLRRWGGELRQQVRKAVSSAMRSEATTLRDQVRQHVATQMTVVKRSFLKGFSTRIYDRDPNRLPALHVGSRIPWAGIHEQGGTIAKRLLIPLHGRVGRKRFKAQVTELIRGGNAYFVKNDRGHIVLMAENIAEHDRVLAGFKRLYRKAQGIKRIQRGSDVPIAVLVPKVVLRKRLDVQRMVASRIPTLAAAVERQIANLN